MREYSFNGLAGCVVQRKARSTGTLVGLYHGEQAGIDAEGWCTVCEVHGTVITHDTRRLAESHLAAPQDWCEECGGRSVPMEDMDAPRGLATSDETQGVVSILTHVNGPGDLDRAERHILALPDGPFKGTGAAGHRRGPG